MSDFDYDEEYEVQAVKLEPSPPRGRWNVTLEFDFFCAWDRKAGLPQPKVGDVVRVRGMVDDPGSVTGLMVVRGDREMVVLDITPEEAEQRRQEMLEATWDEHKEATHGEFQNLPDILKDRVLEGRPEEEGEEQRTWDIENYIDRVYAASAAVLLHFVLPPPVVIEDIEKIHEDDPSVDIWRSFPTGNKRREMWLQMRDDMKERLLLCIPAAGTKEDQEKMRAHVDLITRRVPEFQTFGEEATDLVVEHVRFLQKELGYPRVLGFEVVGAAGSYRLDDTPPA